MGTTVEVEDDVVLVMNMNCTTVDRSHLTSMAQDVFISPASNTEFSPQVLVFDVRTLIKQGHQRSWNLLSPRRPATVPRALLHSEPCLPRS
jgi:hypothetical protein